MTDLSLPWSHVGFAIVDAKGRIVAQVSEEGAAGGVDGVVRSLDRAAFIVRCANTSVENGLREASLEIDARLHTMVERESIEEMKAKVELAKSMRLQQPIVVTFELQVEEYATEALGRRQITEDAIDRYWDQIGIGDRENARHTLETEADFAEREWRLSSEWSTDREAVQLAMKPGERFVVRRRPA